MRCFSREKVGWSIVNKNLFCSFDVVILRQQDKIKKGSARIIYDGDVQKKSAQMHRRGQAVRVNRFQNGREER